MGVLARRIRFLFVAISVLWFVPGDALARGDGGHAGGSRHAFTDDRSHVHFAFRSPQRRIANPSGGISSGSFIGSNAANAPRGRRFSNRIDGAGSGDLGWGRAWGWDGGDDSPAPAPAVAAPSVAAPEETRTPAAALPPCHEAAGDVTIIRGRSCRT